MVGHSNSCCLFFLIAAIWYDPSVILIPLRIQYYNTTSLPKGILGHGPFSHTFEKFLAHVCSESARHEELSLCLLEDLLKAASPKLKNMCKDYGLDFSLEFLPDGSRKLGADLQFVEDLIEPKQVKPGSLVMSYFLSINLNLITISNNPSY